MLPSFDADTFPFLAISGNKTLNILNIKTQMMQPLVDADVRAYLGQQSFFFKKEKQGYSFHFVTYTSDIEGNRFNNWHCMILNDDFFLHLKSLGRLPKPSVQEYIKEIAEHEQLKLKYKALEQK